jgi:glycerate kinase
VCVVTGPRVVVAPNAFRSSLHAGAVAEAMARGVLAALPGASVACVPMSDGGDGLLDVLGGHIGVRLHEHVVRNPLGRPVRAALGYHEGSELAVIEMALASGLRAVAPGQRDPLRSSTYGTGQLILAALDLGARSIVLGAGGSATIDVGAGALHALGASFRDRRGRELEPVPAALAGLAAVDLRGLDRRLAGVTIAALADVATPVERNAAVYGAQKGLAPGGEPAVSLAVAAMARAARETAGVDILGRPWLGGAGGLAGGLAAFLGATVEPGAASVARRVGLPGALARAGLVLTGEGRLDRTTFEGKVPAVVLEIAAAHGVPCALVAGAVDRDALPAFPALRWAAPPAGVWAGADIVAELAGEVAALALPMASRRP